MSDEKAEATDGGGGSLAAGAAAGGGGSKLVMIASIVNMVATLLVVVVLLISFQKEKSKPSVDDIVAGQAKKEHGEAKAEAKGGHSGEGHGEGGHGEGHGEKAEEVVTDAGKIIPLDAFTVNLASGVGTMPRYVRMNVSIELEQGVSDQEFNVKVPRVRDTVINLLNSKKASEINAPDGRDQLKEEIKHSLNSFLMQSKVKGVYFTNFAVSN
jgi:flagellar protein FliL